MHSLYLYSNFSKLFCPWLCLTIYMIPVLARSLDLEILAAHDKLEGIMVTPIFQMIQTNCCSLGNFTLWICVNRQVFFPKVAFFKRWLLFASYVKEGVFEKDEIMPRASLQEVGLTIKEKFYDFHPYLSICLMTLKEFLI